MEPEIAQCGEMEEWPAADDRCPVCQDGWLIDTRVDGIIACPNPACGFRCEQGMEE